MSWGDQQQPYDPNNPYGQQQPQQPFAPTQPQQQSQQQPAQQQPPAWGTPQQPYASGTGYPQGPQTPPYPQAYGRPEFGQYPAPPKKGNGLFIGIVVGALVVVGGGITAAVLLTGNHTHTNAGGGGTSSAAATTSATSGGWGGGGGGGESVNLTAPDGVRGLTLLKGSVADAAVSQMKSSLSGESEEYPDPLLAAYNDAGGNDVTTILVDEAMDKLSASDRSQLTSAGDATAVVAEIMSGAGVSDAQPQSTDASDGALSCGTKDESGTDVTICVWYDGKTFGTLQYVDETSVDDAAPVADAVRAAAES